MRLIRPRSSELVVSFEHFFEHASAPGSGSGFAFPCTEDGTLLPDAHEIARENFAACVLGRKDVVDRGILRHEHVRRLCAIGLCNRCENEVRLDGFTNSCACGADYNGAGQELAPRSQWGEETGETADEILAAEATGFREVES